MGAERRGESGLPADENRAGLGEIEGEGPVPDQGEPGRVPELGSQEPPWDPIRVEAGNEFNRAQAPEYPANEVVCERGQRLDSYRPGEEIVSRKRTQLAEIPRETAIGYVTELAEKYPPGTPLRDTPRNRAVLGVPAGEPVPPLGGQMILEVSVQAEPIPPTVGKLARRLGIEIRDFNGEVLN
jgi:hypothetical protein